MHISMFHGIQGNYVQITCHQERYQDRLLELGFVKRPEDLPLDWPQAPEQAEDTLLAEKLQEQEEVIADLREKLALFESQKADPVVIDLAPSESESVTETRLIERINAMQSKDEVEALIKEKFQIDIDKRGSLETVKEKALAIINKPAE